MTSKVWQLLRGRTDVDLMRGQLQLGMQDDAAPGIYGEQALGLAK